MQEPQAGRTDLGKLSSGFHLHSVTHAFPHKKFRETVKLQMDIFLGVQRKMLENLFTIHLLLILQDLVLRAFPRTSLSGMDAYKRGKDLQRNVSNFKGRGRALLGLR